jgi:hypothetical protein
VAQRDHIEDRINAIKKVLGIESSAVVTRETPTVGVQMAFGKGKSVKTVVKDVLRDNPGARATDVTSFLRQRGYTTGGGTSLSHRVYNEIWRMARDGEVRKNPDGGFTVLQEAG